MLKNFNLKDKKSITTYLTIGIVLLLLFKFWNKALINEKDRELSKIDLTEINKKDIFMGGFKQFLKEKRINMDIDIVNEYETLQPKNVYTNQI